MMKKKLLFIALAIILPLYASAQGIADTIGGLHGVLDNLYEEMMPLCSGLIGVGSAIAGFAALWYIAARGWRHLASNEPIDFYPLFRPFVIGFCVINFTLVLGLINGLMKPTVTGTAAMLEDTNKSIELLLAQKEKALKDNDIWKMYVGESGKGNRDEWYRYTHDNASPGDEGFFDSVGNDIRFALEKAGYNFKNSIREWMSEILRILFEAAALCINTLRTFQLVVLSILGPLVFGLSVFDGFQHTLTVWLARYINIFLWLPVANIFGSIIAKIQQKMIELDLSRMQQMDDTFFSATDAGYLIFLIIGIVGYFTVPSVANYIVHAAGGGALQSRVTNLFSSSTATGATLAGKAADKTLGVAGMAADALGNAAGDMARSMSAQSGTSPYFKDKLKGNS